MSVTFLIRMRGDLRAPRIAILPGEKARKYPVSDKPLVLA